MAIRQLAIVIAALDAAHAFSTTPIMVAGRYADPSFVLPQTGCTCDTLAYLYIEERPEPTWASCSSLNTGIADDVIDNVCNAPSNGCYENFIQSFDENDECWRSAVLLNGDINCERWRQYYTENPNDPNFAAADARRASIQSAIDAFQLRPIGSDPSPSTPPTVNDFCAESSRGGEAFQFDAPCAAVNNSFKLGPVDINTGETHPDAWCYQVPDKSLCDNIFFYKSSISPTQVTFCYLTTNDAGQPACKARQDVDGRPECPGAREIGLAGSSYTGQIINANLFVNEPCPEIEGMSKIGPVDPTTGASLSSCEDAGPSETRCNNAYGFFPDRDEPEADSYIYPCKMNFGVCVADVQNRAWCPYAQQIGMAGGVDGDIDDLS